MIRAIVVEDEPLARRYLVSLLAQTGQVEVIGDSGDAQSAWRVCCSQEVDAAFLDVCMPGGDGLSLAARLSELARPPVVVFVTGFAGHAIDAFRVEAVDYLLKPIDAEAVVQTVRRVERRLARTADSARDVVPDTRLPVKMLRSGAVLLLRQSEVVAAIRRQRSTWLHLASDEGRTDLSLATVERWLGSDPFMRVARDAILNMNAVAEIVRCGDRLFQLTLRDRRGTVVETSRSGAAKLTAYLRSLKAK